MRIEGFIDTRPGVIIMTISAAARQDLGGGLSVRLSSLTAAARATGSADDLRRTLRTSWRAEDTAAGCRDKAADDLARAASGAVHFRWRLEHSAAAWTARAEMLERLDRKFAAR